MTEVNRLIITPGEPAGIGPDIAIQAAQQAFSQELIVIADPQLLSERAKQIGLKLNLISMNWDEKPAPHIPGTLKIVSVPLKTACVPGKLDSNNAAYVKQTLETAADLCEKKFAQAMVTGPVNKSILNEAGIAFTGHTEFFANYCHRSDTVMLFVTEQFKVALLTTHLPLSQVPPSVTSQRITKVVSILNEGLKKQFHITNPRILVCGLNPHAGESGHLGREELEVISPTLADLRQKNYMIQGPIPADTIFTKKYLDQTDVILAMYHDQVLPLVKYASFGHAVNVTLGLPFLRTSVDHGTALDIAGTGKADASSLIAAIELAITLQDRHSQPVNRH